MRWPDIFFKTRKRRPDPTPAPAFKPASEPTKALVGKPAVRSAETAPLPAEPVTPDPTEVGEPVPLPESEAEKAPVLPTPTLPAAAFSDTGVNAEMAEADPLRSLHLSGKLRLSKRTQVEPQSHTGPILLRSEAAFFGKPTASTSPEPILSVPPSVVPTTDLASTENPEADKASEEASFIVPPEDAFRESGPTPGVGTTSTSLRRKAKLTEVARIVAPTEPAEPKPTEPDGESSAIVPPSFDVAVPTGSVMPQTTETTLETPPATIETATQAVAVESEPPLLEAKPEGAPEALPTTETVSAPTPAPVAEVKIENAPPENETIKPEAATPPVSLETSGSLTKAEEKKEFLLTNGERILGRVLSETTDTIYLDHGTLGVLTIPRSQIAQRPVEIILINGDRIVGDIMAETPDTLYVRHASLGMLTVPKAQRSARVVEAILKDGDRILGEVLAETENFTVIRSATLGTVAVPHNKVSMLNRKIEQVALKALSPPSPERKDKPTE